MQFQSHYNRFLLSLEGTKNIYVSFCENIISFCAPRTFRFADYTRTHMGCDIDNGMRLDVLRVSIHAPIWGATLTNPH